MNLLNDIVVLDFSQFLSGPSASLRLADMGARVIKIEKPHTGDICRQLYVSDIVIDGDSTIFHAINRNKESYAANLKNPQHIEAIYKLIAQADVVMHNFRPGVMDRLQLDYETVKKINPSIVYAEISGYGDKGDWRNLPGQDLLLQAASGLTWLSGSDTHAPTAMGVAVADIMAGTHLCQGILAALFQKGRTGEGACIQVSMFESILDFQFEVLTCFYNDGHELPLRSRVNGSHAYIAAPYGLYKTSDGYMALAMTDIAKLGILLDCEALTAFNNPDQWYARRDEIKSHLVDHLQKNKNQYWLNILQQHDVWCAPVLDYDGLMETEMYKVLEMEMTVVSSTGTHLKTTRCPFKIDGQYLRFAKGAPQLGEHTVGIDAEFGLTSKVTPVNVM